MLGEDSLVNARRLLAAVGRAHAPAALDIEALARDIDLFIGSLRSDGEFIEDYKRICEDTFDKYNDLSKHAISIIEILQSEPLNVRDTYQDGNIDRNEIIAKMLLLAEFGAAEAAGKRKAPRRMSDYLRSLATTIGTGLSPIYERHFRRLPAVSKNSRTGKPDGPFIRFALHVLNDRGAELGRRPVTAEGLASALRISKELYSFDRTDGSIAVKRNPMRPRRRGARREP